MTPVKGKRGKLVHAMAYGIRRDLAPEDITTLVCGRKMKGAVIAYDEYVTCPTCVLILFEGN